MPNSSHNFKLFHISFDPSLFLASPHFNKHYKILLFLPKTNKKLATNIRAWILASYIENQISIPSTFIQKINSVSIECLCRVECVWVCVCDIWQTLNSISIVRYVLNQIDYVNFNGKTSLIITVPTLHIEIKLTIPNCVQPHNTCIYNCIY